MAIAEPVLISEARRPSLAVAARELWDYRALVAELTKRTIQLRYKNSVLGVVWSLAPALMAVFIITVVRKYLLGEQIPNYSAYLVPVMFAWTFFTTGIPDACVTLLEHAPMIRKVYFPRELTVVAVVVANLLHLLTALVVAVLYLALLRIFPAQVNWQVLLLVLIVPAQCCVVLGIGLIVSALNVLFEDIRYLVTVLFQLMVYFLPILFPIENVAAAAGRPWASPWLEAWVRPHLLQLYLLNPFAAILVLYQKALLPPAQGTQVPALPWSWALLGQTWLIALATLAAGVLVFQRLKWTVVERL